MQKIVLRTVYLIFGKVLRLTEGVDLFLYETENFFEIFTCYVSTSIALVPSQYIKICWKLQ